MWAPVAEMMRCVVRWLPGHFAAFETARGGAGERDRGASQRQRRVTHLRLPVPRPVHPARRMPYRANQRKQLTLHVDVVMLIFRPRLVPISRVT
jgi:hypothetical protein